MATIVVALPEYGKRNARMNDAILSLASFAVFGDRIKTIPLLEKSIKDRLPHLDFLFQTTKCYVKILEVIGKIIQG